MRLSSLAVAFAFALALGAPATAAAAHHKGTKPPHARTEAVVKHHESAKARHTRAKAAARAKAAKARQARDAAVAVAPPVVVAVVDTGVDESHALLAPHLLGSLNVRDGGSVGDTTGHGSHVAGIVAQTDPDARIMALKISDDSGALDLGAAARAIRYAADSGAKVINVSWVYMGSEPEVHDAIVYAGSRGALVVAAAGNWSWNLDVTGAAWPADESTLPNVVTVAATCDGSTLAPFSNYGHNLVDVAAPGCDISSSWFDGSMHLLSGTSMAAPHVAALAARLFAQNLSASPATIKDELLAACAPSASLADKVVCGGSI